MFRYSPDPKQQGYDVPFLELERRFYEKQWGLADEVHWLLAEAFQYAISAYAEHQTFGMPNAGGSMAQPVYWKMAVRCIFEAKRRADLEVEMERDAKAAREAAYHDDVAD